LNYILPAVKLFCYTSFTYLFICFTYFSCSSLF